MTVLHFARYEPAHLSALEVQPAQAWLARMTGDRDYAASIAVPGLTWTALAAGKVLGIAGVAPHRPGLAEGWAIFGPVPPQAWTRITRKTRSVLELAHASGYWRIEAHVDARFTAGIRWIKLLGFEVEGYCKAYSPEKRDHMLYARIRDVEADLKQAKPIGPEDG